MLHVTQIFDDPKFFIPNASYNNITRGATGDCNFIAALALIRAAGKLALKLCVARDEEVSVYGFIFFRDTSWVTVIIDDFLYTYIPKYEELSYAEKQIYHVNKESTTNRHVKTWVPLIKKAYAKLYGSYAALYGGELGEAIEDMTGYHFFSFSETGGKGC
ncbi:hypothetical protein V5O48_014648 [Marasmius crinis-equi]|uniref:Calpain catalytic domain-containing protein n=1 Tax=Marasmius crinis-equi TaxID=585013 RepID=A0ABR3EWQ7_9AGAR